MTLLLLFNQPGVIPPSPEEEVSAGGGGRSDEGLFVPRDETLIFIMFAAMLADE
jgi:hypothetical protein